MNICKDKKRKQLVLNLKCAEELCCCYTLVHSMTKPRQAGGILHIKIPPPPESSEAPSTSIYDPKEMEARVLEQHRTHFSQAEGTIFTQEPLQTLLNDSCTSVFAEQVLAGTAEIDDLLIDDYTKDLLCNMKSKMSPAECSAHTGGLV